MRRYPPIQTVLNNLIVDDNIYHSCSGPRWKHPSHFVVGTFTCLNKRAVQSFHLLNNENVVSFLACREHILAPSVRVLGVQEKAGMQMEVQQERNRAELVGRCTHSSGQPGGLAQQDGLKE